MDRPRSPHRGQSVEGFLTTSDGGGADSLFDEGTSGSGETEKQRDAGKTNSFMVL